MARKRTSSSPMVVPTPSHKISNLNLLFWGRGCWGIFVCLLVLLFAPLTVSCEGVHIGFYFRPVWRYMHSSYWAVLAQIVLSAVMRFIYLRVQGVFKRHAGFNCVICIYLSIGLRSVELEVEPVRSLLSQMETICCL